MKAITITQLTYVAAVAQARNFGLAAKACFVSQPTLSMQIQKLEAELGVTLFDRSKRPVEPTAIGRGIVRQARVVLQEVRRIEELIAEEQDEVSGEFRLGIIPTLAPYLLPLFLESFTQTYPRVSLIIEELQTRQIITRLGDDTLDAGILVTPLNCRGIIERPLFYEPFVVYLAPGHAYRSRTRVAENDLSLDDIWLLNEGHCFRDQAIELCKKVRDKGFESKNPMFESGNLETLKRLVDKKFGYTLLPYLAIAEMPEGQRKKRTRLFKAPVPTREVSLVYSRAFLKKRMIDALANAIESSVPATLRHRPGKSRVVELPTF